MHNISETMQYICRFDESIFYCGFCYIYLMVMRMSRQIDKYNWKIDGIGQESALNLEC